MPFTQALRAADSLLLVIDLQEKLLPVIPNGAEVVAATQFLLTAAATMAVPVLITEQYPAGLGGTDPRLIAAAPQAALWEKTHFSAAAEAGFVAQLRALGQRQIIVAGTETHICVLQTVLGLLRLNLDVFVVADAVGSRAASDRALGLDRLRDAGARLISAEMAVYEWLEHCGAPAFQALRLLLKSWRDG